MLGRRISAALIDLALLLGLFVILALAIGERRVEGGSVSLSLNGGPAAIYFALVLIYYFALEAALGQTVGKLLLNLRVVRADGSRPSLSAIAVRTLLRIVDWLPLLYLVGFITMMVTGRRRQRLGDLAAKTTIAPAQPARRRTLGFAPMALLLILIVALAVYRAADSGGGKSVSIATTVRLPATGAVLFRDDFSNKRREWYVGRDRSSSGAYVNGRYRIAVSEANSSRHNGNKLDHPSDAISVTAVLSQAAGGGGDELGVDCLSTGLPIQGYVLAIGPSDGFVAVGRIRRAIWKQIFVRREGEDAVEPRGDVNRIRADCLGARHGAPARLTLYANGHLIAQATVQGGFKRLDGIALYVFSHAGGTTALFDDVVVRELKRG